MLRALIIKQLREVGAFMVQNSKTGKRRTIGNKVAYSLMLVAVAILMFVIFGYMADTIAEPLIAIGLDWFFFSTMGLVAIAMGVLGSVFSTYASLYLAKDNEVLLAMPIPSWMILVVRMFGVYFMGLIYESLVMIPTVVVYITLSGASLGTGLISVLMIFSISIFVLILSCVLGYVVALISSKLKSKSFITVLISLVFIAAYYVCYMKAISFLQDIAIYGQEFASKIQNALFLFYHMGKAGTGDVSAFLIYTGICLVVLAVCFLVLSKSFLKLATSNRGGVKRVYKETQIKTSSVKKALFRKEITRFTRSASYMLNCGLGAVFALMVAVIGIFLMLNVDVWNLSRIREAIFMMTDGNTDYIGILVLVGCVFLTSSTTITAPSISLEGKSLWILQSLPINVMDVFVAKIKLHMYVGGVPTLFALLTLALGFHVNIGMLILIMITGILYILWEALLGLLMNLRRPNFNWSNENVPIKQNMNVVFVLLEGWSTMLGFGLIYLWLYQYIPAKVYVALLAVVLVVLNGLQYYRLKSKWVKDFANL